MSDPEDRLRTLGIELPVVAPPRPTIVAARRAGDLMYLSARGPVDASGRPAHTGKVGAELDLMAGKAAARAVGLTLLATLRTELGSLNEVAECIKVTGIVNCAPGFTATGDVVDGCSELLLDVFGDEAGRHVRTTLGAAELPNNYPVVVELMVRVRSIASPSGG
jgi:hypothetical protein